MCGIFGYIGGKSGVKTVLEGLKKLEYRGYDSAGVAGISQGQIAVHKEVGKVAKLEQIINEHHIELSPAIAHTRWATHGKPSAANAHPHTDTGHTIALVHNGIIENHELLRTYLKEKGVTFLTDTDTEVIAQLIAFYYKDDLLSAIRDTIARLKGSYALALIHRDYPDTIVAVAHESPLVLGIGSHEMYISSDPNACAPYTRDVIYLEDREIAFVTADNFEIFDPENGSIKKEAIQLKHEIEEPSKGVYEHYTLKEIFEQPRTIRQALLARCSEEYGNAIFDEEGMETDELFAIDRIIIVACGTSWHAGCAAAYMIEEMARIPVQVEISSEFRYKNPIVLSGTLVIAISQSGETADTIAAVRELREKGAPVIAICNVMGSSLTRISTATLYLRAGPEIGVASTKAFTSQLIVLSLIALYLSRMRDMNIFSGQEMIFALEKLPDQIKSILDQAPHIHEIAKKYARYDNFFYLGRRTQYPAALEGALKLKEISYINANAYPAGEMKHGPIALINAECPSVALCGDIPTFDKLCSNLMEVKARDGKIIAIAMEGQNAIKGIADDIIWIPKTFDCLSIIPTTVVTQLLAYYIAKERGSDIDQPRNLAKSVTVE